MSTLIPVVEERLKARGGASDYTKPVSDNQRQRTHADTSQMDCMQWVIDTSPRKITWTTERMIGEILALWFGSVHSLAIVRTPLARYRPCANTVLDYDVRDTRSLLS